MPIPDIFKKYGEPYFRKLETDIIKELCDFNGIAACGGGAMLSDINSGIARENGIVVFLDVPFKTCFYRISGDSNRPVAASRTPKQLEELFIYGISFIKKLFKLLWSTACSKMCIRDRLKSC